MERLFVEDVDLQNALFHFLRKYDTAAFDDRQFFPKFWEKGGQPEVLVFLGDVSNRIKALHAQKKRQQALAPIAVNEMSKEPPKEAVPKEGKGKKVRRPYSSFYLVNILIQSKVQFPFPKSKPTPPDDISDTASSLRGLSSLPSTSTTANQAQVKVIELFLARGSEAATRFVTTQ
jgi:hypothetical protein